MILQCKKYKLLLRRYYLINHTQSHALIALPIYSRIPALHLHDQVHFSPELEHAFYVLRKHWVVGGVEFLIGEPITKTRSKPRLLFELIARIYKALFKALYRHPGIFITPPRQRPCHQVNLKHWWTRPQIGHISALEIRTICFTLGQPLRETGVL